MDRQEYLRRMLQPDPIPVTERYEDRLLQLDESIWGGFKDKIKGAISTVKKKVNSWLKGADPEKKKKAEQMRSKIEKLEGEYRKRKDKAIAKVKDRAKRQGISLKQAEEDVPWMMDIENWIGNQVMRFEREILGIDVEGQPSKLTRGDIAAAGRRFGGSSGRTSGGTGAATKTRGYLESVGASPVLERKGLKVKWEKKLDAIRRKYGLKLIDLHTGMKRVEERWKGKDAPVLFEGKDPGALLNTLTESLSVLEAADDDVWDWWEEMEDRLPRSMVLDIHQKIKAKGLDVRLDPRGAERMGKDLVMYREAMADVLRRARAEIEVKLAVIAHETKSEKTHRTLIRNMQVRAQTAGRSYGLVELEQIWRQAIDNEDIRRGTKGDTEKERDKWFFARVMKSFKAKIGLSESVLNESWDILSWLRKHWTLVKTTVGIYQQDPSKAKAHVRELEKQFGDQVQESLQEATDEPPSFLMKAVTWLWGLHPSTQLLWWTAVAALHVGLTQSPTILGGSLLVGGWVSLLGWVLKFRGVVESGPGRIRSLPMAESKTESDFRGLDESIWDYIGDAFRSMWDYVLGKSVSEVVREAQQVANRLKPVDLPEASRHILTVLDTPTQMSQRKEGAKFAEVLSRSRGGEKEVPENIVAALTLVIQGGGATLLDYIKGELAASGGTPTEEAVRTVAYGFITRIVELAYDKIPRQAQMVGDIMMTQVQRDLMKIVVKSKPPLVVYGPKKFHEDAGRWAPKIPFKTLESIGVHAGETMESASSALAKRLDVDACMFLFGDKQRALEFVVDGTRTTVQESSVFTIAQLLQKGLSKAKVREVYLLFGEGYTEQQTVEGEFELEQFREEVKRNLAGLKLRSLQFCMFVRGTRRLWNITRFPGMPFLGESASGMTEIMESEAWGQLVAALHTNKQTIMQMYQSMMDDPDEFDRRALEMKEQYETGRIPESFLGGVWEVIKSPWELFKFLKATAKELLASPNLSERALIALGISIVLVCTQVGVLGVVGFLGKIASAIIGVMIFKEMIFGSKPK